MAQMPQPLDPAIAAGRAPKAHEKIIIVGGGLAGMSAALSALEAGGNVVLVDKEANLGGNSAKASSGINGCNTKIQKRMGISDSPELFHHDTMTAGDRENDHILVDILVRDSASAVHFLIDNGVALEDINLLGGHSVPRTHWLLSPKEGRPLPIGVAIIRALQAKLEEWRTNHPDKLQIRLNTRVLGLVTWNDYITGVRVHGEGEKIDEINGKAVVLTTGGFSADRDNETSLLSEFAALLLNLPTTNGNFASGDGVKMARAMGAGLVGMDKVQVHPTAFIDPKNPNAGTKFLAAEALRGKGAILVNEQGKRFGNELGRRDHLTDLINKNCARQSEMGNLPIAYMLMNNESAESFGRPAFTFYAKIKGFFKELLNVNELANEIGCPVEQLRKTLEDYNTFVDQKASDTDFKDPFGKNVFPFKFNMDQPFFVAKITPAIHYTMGGLQIDRHTFVYNEFMHKPFEGLLAAGEVTGGVHGSNRLGGNSLLECVVFGRIAGKQAAEINYQASLGVKGFADQVTNGERRGDEL